MKSLKPKDGEAAIRIDGQPNVCFGRHFDEKDQICSIVTRRSIDALKDHFREELTNEDWQLVKQLKKFYKIE